MYLANKYDFNLKDELYVYFSFEELDKTKRVDIECHFKNDEYLRLDFYSCDLFTKEIKRFRTIDHINEPLDNLLTLNGSDYEYYDIVINASIVNSDKYPDDFNHGLISIGDASFVGMFKRNEETKLLTASLIYRVNEKKLIFSSDFSNKFDKYKDVDKALEALDE